MLIDELDIELEDDDGTGVRIGTLRYHSNIVQYSVIDNSTVVWISRLGYPFLEHEDTIIGEILKIV